MITKIAEYKIKEHELDAVLLAIQKFVREVKHNEPETFYEAYRKGDSLEFIHLMKFKDREAEKKHQQAAYTAKFVGVLYPHCTVEPRFTDVTQIE